MLNISNYQIVLASKSPRRKQLLTQLGISFEIKNIEIDESYPKDLLPYTIAEYISKKKANHVAKDIIDGQLIICADTIVTINNSVLGKPNNSSEAKQMLKELSGKSHEVITGVCLTNKEKERSFSVITTVTMKELNKDEIDYYVDNFNSLDKAGAYGIQDWIGLIGVEKIEGSFYNVVGLPIKELFEELKQF